MPCSTRRKHSKNRPLQIYAELLVIFLGPKDAIRHGFARYDLYVRESTARDRLKIG